MNGLKTLMTSAGILASLIICACATLTPTTSGKSVEGQIPQNTDSSGASSTDPVSVDTMLPSQPLTLEACIAFALKNNPSVAAVWWETQAATAETRVQSGKRLPNIHLTGSYFHYQDDQRLVAPSSLGEASYFTDDLVSSDLVLRLPLFTGGRLVNAVRAAELLEQSSRHALARTREELVFNVTSVFYAILARQQVIHSIEFSQQTLQEHLERVKDLIAVGKSAKVDRLRTEVRLADVTQQHIAEKNLLAIETRALMNFMGVSGGDTFTLVLSGQLDLPAAAAAEVDTAVVRALEQRQDYAAALAAVEAQARRVDIARGVREPQVTLEASYGGRWGIGGSGEPVAQSSSAYSWNSGPQPGASVSRTSALPDGRTITSTVSETGAVTTRLTSTGVSAADDVEDVGRIGIVVDVPLFEGGSLRAEIAKERAILRETQQRLRQLELQVRLEVETAALNLNSARERAAVTQKSIAEAEESLRIEREKYDFGKGAIVDVLDAQSELLHAQTTHYRVLADINTARAQLALAMGEPL